VFGTIPALLWDKWNETHAWWVTEAGSHDKISMFAVLKKSRYFIRTEVGRQLMAERRDARGPKSVGAGS
jgi:hypothetical protein